MNAKQPNNQPQVTDEMAVEMLDQLANLESAKDILMLTKQEQVDKVNQEIERALHEVLTDEQRKKLEVIRVKGQAALNEIDAEYAGKTEITDQKMAGLRKELDDMVKALGHTVKGSFKQMQFVRNKGKFDSDALLKVLDVYPWLKAHYTPGEPSTRLVNNKS